MQYEKASAPQFMKYLKGKKGKEIEALINLLDLEFTDNNTKINKTILKNLKMTTKAKKFTNDVDSLPTKKGLDFYNFQSENDSAIFILGNKTSIKIEDENKETFELTEIETGETFIAPTNKNLIYKLNKVYEILLDAEADERQIKITYLGKEKIEGSKFMSKIFKVQY